MLSSWSIAELLVWNKWKCLGRRVVTGHVAPYNWRWREDVENWDSLILQCRAELSPKLWQFLKEVLLAAVLCRIAASDRFKIGDLIASFCDDQPLPPHCFTSMQWSVAPWVMVHPAREKEVSGRVCCFLVGVGDFDVSNHLPSWWTCVADRKARKSVEDAIKMVHDRLGVRPVVRPLLIDRERLQIAGSSLGLAVYAGALRARRGYSMKEPLLFTGGVTSTGKFTDPGLIREKATVARQFGFKVLICGSGTPSRRVLIRDGVETIPVFDPEELEWVLASYDCGIGRKALKQVVIMSGPDLMASKIGQIDLRITRSPIFRHRYINAVKKILEVPENARIFAENLARLCYVRSYEKELWEHLLKPLLSLVRKSACQIDPVALWHITSCGWACAVTEGSVEEADEWSLLANQALTKIARTPQHLEFLADYHNRLLVQSRHLNFHFRPDLPKEFVAVLEKLEALYGLGNFQAYAVLGRMYGTIAQNYGFCGPDYLDRLVDYVIKAQRAFGKGEVRDLYEDWRREFNYMIYGYLDAGFFNEAELCLQCYLNKRVLRDAQVSPQARYELAALVRFAADTGLKSVISDVTVNFLLKEPLFSHPFQLILFNLGRVLKDRDRKRKAWMKSLEIALHFKGPRSIFGLLPICALYKEELASLEEIIRGVERIRIKVGRLQGFNFAHFEGIFDDGICEDLASLEGYLRKLWQRRDRFFPFTYR